MNIYSLGQSACDFSFNVTVPAVGSNPDYQVAMFAPGEASSCNRMRISTGDATYEVVVPELANLTG